MNTAILVKQPRMMPSFSVKVPVQPVSQRCFASGPVKVQIHGALACIEMPERFDFQLWRNFNDAYRPLLDDDTVERISVEMSEIKYMDSSAMGMLLLLNERAKTANKALALFSASSFVSRVLRVANFSKVFNIDHVRISQPGLLS